MFLTIRPTAKRPWFGNEDGGISIHLRRFNNPGGTKRCLGKAQLLDDFNERITLSQ